MQMSQINTEKTVYVGIAWLKKYVLRFFLKDKDVGKERTVLGKWFQKMVQNMQKSEDHLTLCWNRVKGKKNEENENLICE